jgi:predicted AAA+ superfamily ATPase
MNLKPWREIAVPHEDVLRGTFVQAEFAADISRVHAGTADAEYQNPSLFFQRTFITEGMRLLLDSVVRRLSGKGGDPVIQLQTAFGGGKTHTMLAVYHLASGKSSATDMPGIPAILDAAGVAELPKARIAVIDGIKSSPNQPIDREGTSVCTLWGDLAWQLGGADAYSLVKDADVSGTSPGKEVLQALLSRHAPCVILVDELVAYVRQFEEGKTLTGGTLDSNLTFIQALTEALKAVPNALMLASLPESEREAGSQRGVQALAALSHYFGRVQAIWKPVATQEAFEIVRRRLFNDVTDRLAAESVCREFADYYTNHGADFPRETQDSGYYQRLLQAYPIHPEVFERLYEDWATLDNFQRTRGVLKLMAQVIHRLWQDNNKDALIMPGSLPLADAQTRTELINYLPPGWDPVIERDVDGDRAETTEIESAEPRFGSIQACRRNARAIFLGSAPTTSNQVARGIDLSRVMLGVVTPGQQIEVYKDALRRLGDKLHYLNTGNNRFWFDTRPNLRREMEERKRRFQDREDVFPLIRDRLSTALRAGQSNFQATHVFNTSFDIPDDWHLRLVVLPPDSALSRSGPNQAQVSAEEILKKRGDQPRFKQNRLIFIAADQDNVSRLRDQVRSVLAWTSIVNDIKELRLNLDVLQSKQASKSLDEATEALRRMVRETYKWLLAPVQTAQPGKGISSLQWESFPLNAGAANFQDEISRVLKDNELLITDWAPIHLARMVKEWFWKADKPAVKAIEIWQRTCQDLFLPRLRDDDAFYRTLLAGMESRDFFALSQGVEGDKYLGFLFGKRGSVLLDEELLLIEPSEAQAFEARTIPMPPVTPIPTEGGASPVPPQQAPASSKLPGSVVTQKSPKTRFFGNVALDAIQARRQFTDIADEVISLLANRNGTQVRISIDIEATTTEPFDDSIQRSVRENCTQLKFLNNEFED